MFLSGIADESGQDLETQIRAHQELGWRHIELRTIDGTCVTDIDDAAFEILAGRLADAGLQVSCIGAQLANWARPIDTDFEIDVAELRRAIPRMQRLGVRFIRCMSYPNSDPPLPEEDWKSRVIERMKRLTEIAEAGDVVLVHENCHGWASQNAGTTNDFLREISSANMKLVFDTGNPIGSGQNVWELYRALRENIVYVHIKDYKRADAGAEGTTACFPGEGEGYVPEIITDLLQTGYDGGFSIEPHITSVIHLDQTAEDPELGYRTYVEYGRRLEELIDQTGGSA